MFEIVRYRLESGKHPFDEWLQALRDRTAQSRILSRIRQVESGNFGDCAPVGDGVLELRVHVGAGYRAYIGRHGQVMVVLLCGGDKATQQRDIDRAKQYWADWKRRQQR
ncbi:MAG: type II toxin-antitoxin system RelE/ParE family toxin [Terracidiphilus sp.]